MTREPLTEQEAQQQELARDMAWLGGDESYILPAKAVARLRRGGKAYAKHQRAISKREWYFGQLVNFTYANLKDDVKEEVRMSDFYSECSQWINKDVPFPICSESGETLRRWCEVAAHYETFPEVAAWREVLSFDHFRIAKSIGGDPTSNITSAQALAFAVKHNLTADQMRAALTERKEQDPRVLEIRSKFAPWLANKGIPDVLLSMNGNRKQAEYHLHEFERLVASDDGTG